MLAKFPADVNVKFKWYNIFDPKSFVDSPDLCFERAAVLFNIGVVYFRMGLREKRSDAESLVRASSHFQVST